MTTPTPPSEPAQPTQATPAQLPPYESPTLTHELIAAAAAAYLSTVIGPWLASITPAVLPAVGVVDPFGVMTGSAVFLAGLRQFMRQKVAPWLFEPLVRLFGRQRAEVIFDQQPFVREYMAQIQNLLSRIPDEVFTRIRAIVAAAADAGTPAREVADLIRGQLLEANAPMWRGRAETIARTELRRAQMGGLFNAYSTFGQSQGMHLEKVWLDSDDTRVRPAHVDTDGQRRPLMMPFAVGTHEGLKFPGMYPCDPLLPPNMSINCRCDMLIEQVGKPTDMSDRRFQRTTPPAPPLPKQLELFTLDLPAGLLQAQPDLHDWLTGRLVTVTL